MMAMLGIRLAVKFAVWLPPRLLKLAEVGLKIKLRRAGVTV